MKKKAPLLAILGLAVSLAGYGQTVDSTDVSMMDMSLEELMNVEVVSASKKSESLFEAPLSIGSVNRDEIQKSGATSIVEALRLIPGILVTEVTNGNYEVNIRGLNNMPPATSLNNASNSITLVMIDNRPVYNYFSGGTFWETLPVDLNDVERIEVVRGASSALYGPNAAAGVINIITRRANKEGLYAAGNVQKGTLSYIQNGSVGFKRGKFDMIVSGNYQNRQRTESDYYVWSKGEKLPVDSIDSYLTGPLTNVKGVPNTNERYPDPKLALNKYGYNAFMNYAISEKSNIGLSMGGQKSVAQKAFIDNLATPLSTTESSTNYIDARGKFNNLNAMVAYQFGTQDASKGFNGYKYDFNTIDAVTEYDINLKNFSLRPGLNYRKAEYNDSKYADVTDLQGFLNGSKSLINYAGSLRAEYKLKEAFKMIAAARYDLYNHPDKGYLSYQIAPSYKFSDRHFVRAAYSRSYRGPNMYNSYNSQSLLVGVSPMPTYAIITGNENLNLLKVDMIEIGYRSKLTDNFHIDVDVFQQIASNFSYLVGQATSVVPGKIVVPQTIENIAMKANQKGVTVSANYVYKKLQFKPSITFQETQLIDAPRYRNSVASNATNNINVTYDSTHTGTPSFFGGAYLNYQVSSKINVNVSAYYFGLHKYNNIYTLVGPNNGQNGFVTIPSKLLVNARVSYKPVEQLDLFVSVRNALNQTSYEFVKTDKTRLMTFFGANLNF